MPRSGGEAEPGRLVGWEERDESLRLEVCGGGFGVRDDGGCFEAEAARFER